MLLCQVEAHDKTLHKTAFSLILSLHQQMVSPTVFNHQGSTISNEVSSRSPFWRSFVA